MRVILFGASGMVGQGVLRECLADARVERVLTIGRRPVGLTHAKLDDLVHADFTNYADVSDRLRGFDACFFCLGVSAMGLSEAEYSRITYDVTLAAAHALVAVNSALTFVYVSGTGTDSSEQGRVMWARVKGRTENALQRLPFKAVYLFRPGFIQPLHGIQSSTALYRTLYAITAPITPLLKRLAPTFITTTELVARAMIGVALHGHSNPVLYNADINQVGTALTRGG